MEQKILNDTAAWGRARARLRGRNAEWAARAVTDSISATASEALDLKVVDMIAKDVRSLRGRIDGREVTLQAESERERRAKVIHANGEFQASERLRDAAEKLKGHPKAMLMRFLQTLVEVGAENNTTIVFPIPINLLSTFAPNASRPDEEKQK